MATVSSTMCGLEAVQRRLQEQRQRCSALQQRLEDVSPSVLSASKVFESEEKGVCSSVAYTSDRISDKLAIGSCEASRVKIHMFCWHIHKPALERFHVC